MTPSSPLGRHLLADLHGVNAGLLADPYALEQALRQAALAAGATILFAHFHHFGEGQGVTGVLLLKESHISIHTWPEHGYAAVDVFMCGVAKPERALAVLVERMKPAYVDSQVAERGGVVSPLQRRA